MKKTSVLNNGLIWFGAAVSIAEIMTGTYLAPLGMCKGIAAIVIGHLIGCTLLFLAGLIGGKSERSAMETVKMSFGEKGSLLFSVLNVLQLVGWTAIMIISGARAAATILPQNALLSSTWFWCLIIGALILVWIAIGIKNLGPVNVVAMGGLFILTVILSTVVFGSGTSSQMGGDMSFGAAVELSVAMPLSWLPLISDYTKNAKHPVKATAASAVVYFAASCWMYVIGLGAAIFTGGSDIASIMVKAGLGIAGLLIIIISTVTTTFLDAYSAGVSSVSIWSKLKEKQMAGLVCIVGTILAIATPIENFESFLYLIGSVFAPMIAIQIADYFILKNEDGSKKPADVMNLVLWLAGFVIYRLLMSVDTVVGYTLPAMLVTCVLCIVAYHVKKRAHA